MEKVIRPIITQNIVNLPVINSIKKRNGTLTSFDLDKIRINITRACKNYNLSETTIIKELFKNIHEGIETIDIEKALILSTVPLIEQDPEYDHVATTFLLQKIYKEVLNSSTTKDTRNELYKKSFINNIYKLVEMNFIDKRLLDFNLNYMASAIDISKDKIFNYIGLQTLYEKYFLKNNGIRFETPQAFWMRIAMGISLLEKNKEEKAIEFYNLISSMAFVPSTPTLLHAGLIRPQLSSCYLTTVKDDLFHIFKCIGDNAQMSKWSGGVANDWTNIRSTGSLIKTVNIGSQGLVPFLKITNDVTVAISRSGSRRGATVVYLETWHLEIEDFLDLKKNTGDERRRTHDINTAHWIPDLFMKRVLENKEWTLFTPNEVPDLHDLYGKKFEKRYEEYEAFTQTGEITLYKVIPAKELWKKMLTRLFETGHPWLTFKDAFNIRSPQDHVGVIHSSNLCTEISLNTSSEETAVCNLGSINLEKHINNGEINKNKITKTIQTAMRMLDNIIDINFYPTKEGENSNLKHRPVGLGMMGFQDALFKLNINFDSQEALVFANEITEFFSYHAILASSKLAKERGAYLSYKGSKWNKNIFPIDTITLLEEERGLSTNVTKNETLNWQKVRDHVKQYGMRNSNTMAIAPTATISNISGCLPCIEPIYKNIYVKSNMSGEFTIINNYLVNDLKKLNLWNQDMLDQIKFHDGNIEKIQTIPQNIRAKYKEAFDIDPEWLLKLTAERGKWIDQSQSHNVFLKGVSGQKLNTIYLTAWKLGLKSTYYLRTLGASQIEKSTLDAKKFGFTQKRNNSTTSCNINDQSCESCQ